MAQIMTNQEFVDKLLKVREKYKTCYASGTFGQCATPSFIDQKKKQYPKWYTDSRVNNLKALPDDTRLFDCIGLIKGVLWGFPNTKYKSNGVAEGNDQDYWNMALDKSKSFSQIQIGEILWMKGHVGVYIGNGKAIECTASWQNKVQITVVANMGLISGLNSRRWEGHGKIPYINYIGNSNKVNPGSSGESKDYNKIAQEILNGKWGNGEDRKKKLKAAGYSDDEIKKIQLLVNELCKQPKQPVQQAVYYTVKKGDIASNIAKKQGIAMDQMKKLNPSIKNWDLIYPGQKIRIK